jgi:hypothetical protein
VYGLVAPLETTPPIHVPVVVEQHDRVALVQKLNKENGDISTGQNK